MRCTKLSYPGCMPSEHFGQVVELLKRRPMSQTTMLNCRAKPSSLPQAERRVSPSLYAAVITASSTGTATKQLGGAALGLMPWKSRGRYGLSGIRSP